MLEFLEMSCPSLLILVSTFTSLRLCRWYGLNFNTKQPLQLLFGEPGTTSCFCTSKESKHISVCYFKKKKKEGLFPPILPQTPTRVVKQPGKKGVDRVVRVKVSSVHLCLSNPCTWPTAQEAHASVCLVSQNTESFVYVAAMLSKKSHFLAVFIECSLH